MQAAILPMKAGFEWIQQGWKIFVSQPLPLFMWSMFIGILINLSYVFIIVGQVALFIVTPMLTFLTLSACKRVQQNQKLNIGNWFEPLKNRPEVRKELLKLGGMYLVFCLVAAFISTLPFISGFDSVITADGEINQAALGAAISGPMIVFGFLYVLVSALFWHAPALIGWHKIQITQAMFYSMVACWRNKWPFLVYGASWAALFFVLYKLTSILAGVGISVGALQFLLTPLNLVLVAVLYCSFYPAYLSVFGNNSRFGQST